MARGRWLIALVCVASGCGRIDYLAQGDRLDAGAMDSSVRFDGAPRDARDEQDAPFDALAPVDAPVPVDAPAPVDARDSGGDDEELECDSVIPCDWSCTAARCTYRCRPGTVCTATCAAGSSCYIDCDLGATCTLECDGDPDRFCVGACELECP